MIRRLRLRAPLHIAVLLFVTGYTLTLAATQPVLESHMREFVYWTLGVVLFTVLGSAAAFISYLNSRMERSFEKAIARLEASVAQAFDLMHSHDANPLAHIAAGEHNHGPMNEQSNRIEAKLDALIMEHRIIRGTEDEVCSAIRALGHQKRDPAASPNPKRKDDSGDDYRPLRGKQ